MEDKLFNIYSGSYIQADLVKQLLEDNGIRCIVRNGLMSTIILGEGDNAVDILIEESNIPKAKELLANFDQES